MTNLFQVKSFLSYWINAVSEHSLHSPFLFDFYQQVIKPRNSASPYVLFENLRTKLLNDARSNAIEDMGAGSAYLKTSTRMIKDIARTSLTPKKYCQLYDRLIQFMNCQNILELGTSFGINTLYLANDKARKVTTFEGAEEIAFIANTTFEFAGASNIRLIKGNIDKTLPDFVLSSTPLDMALIDANHRYQPTIKYFDLISSIISANGVVVMDDIHQSSEMEHAWHELRSRAEVHASVDLFKCGILFFDPSLNKQHVVIEY